MCPYRAEKNRFYLDENAELRVFTDTTVIFNKTADKNLSLKGIADPVITLDLHYILGLLNSKLLNFKVLETHQGD